MQSLNYSAQGIPDFVKESNNDDGLSNDEEEDEILNRMRKLNLPARKSSK